MTDTPTPGQIGLVHTKGIPARLIQAITGSHWNHVIIATSTHHAAGAQPGGVRVRPISDFPEVVWSDFTLTPIQTVKILAFTRRQIGKPYNWRDDIFIGLGLLFRTHTPHWMLRELSEESTWQCAQLADAALEHAGVNIFTDSRPNGAVYPASFVPFWQDAGWLTADHPS